MRRTLTNLFASSRRAFWIGVSVLALALTFVFGVAVGASTFGDLPHVTFFPGSHSGSDARAEPGHGLIGSISAIERDTFTVTDKRFGPARTVRVSADTIIERRHGNRIHFAELQVGDQVIVIGAPVEGLLQARYIGVMGDHPVNMTPEPSSENLLDPLLAVSRTAKPIFRLVHFTSWLKERECESVQESSF